MSFFDAHGIAALVKRFQRYNQMNPARPAINSTMNNEQEQDHVYICTDCDRQCFGSLRPGDEVLYGGSWWAHHEGYVWPKDAVYRRRIVKAPAVTPIDPVTAAIDAIMGRFNFTNVHQILYGSVPIFAQRELSSIKSYARNLLEAVMAEGVMSVSSGGFTAKRTGWGPGTTLSLSYTTETVTEEIVK